MMIEAQQEAEMILGTVSFKFKFSGLVDELLPIYLFRFRQLFFRGVEPGKSISQCSATRCPMMITHRPVNC